MSTATIDPITLEVIRNRLQSIADEMERVVIRSAYSIIVKGAADCSTAIHGADGDAVAHAIASPLHLGALGPAMAALLERHPVDTMEDGDLFILNDPYNGGTHLPDVIIVAAVVHDGRPVALTASLAHHQDIGGMVPGSMPANASEIFQEGLIIPPLKLASRGEYDDTILRLIERNVRLPTEVLGDIHAQIGAVIAGRERLKQLFDEYGQTVVLAHLEELPRRTEAMTRAEIERIPDGTYSFVDYLDHDGIDVDTRLLPVKATVTIDGDRVKLDMSGTNPQTKGSANAPPSTVLAAMAYALRTIIEPDIPVNAGSERPLELVLPEGTMVNPRWPAPVSLRAQLGSRVLRAILGALVQAVPDRVAADSGQHDGALGLAGIDHTGAPWGFTFGPVSGMGARPTKDGVNAIDTHLSNLLNVPAEAWEGAYPLRMTRHALRRDSGGAGRWRGGLGPEIHFELLRGDATASWRGDRHFSSAWGLFGGHAGLPWRLLVHRASGVVDEIPGRAIFRLSEGDRVELLCGGSGGWGDPLDREPERVLDDVIDELVSQEAAERDYGLIADFDARAVDREATDALRARMRSNRGPIAWTFDRGPELGVE